MLAFEEVGFAYHPGKPLLAHFDWRVERGTFWAVLGASGSGKTTLLNLAAGLRRPVTGRVLLGGEEVRRPSPRVGLMLQDYGLLPWFDVRRNVELGLEVRGVPRRERAVRSSRWLSRLGLSGMGPEYPARLSGGQRQRVALARLLALEPDVLLLDEPFSAVDELTREGLQRQLFALTREAGRTTLLVTHNIEEAALLASHVLLVTEHAPIREGQVLETPFGGNMPSRGDPAFIRFCQALRERIGL